MAENVEPPPRRSVLRSKIGRFISKKNLKKSQRMIQNNVKNYLEVAECLFDHDYVTLQSESTYSAPVGDLNLSCLDIAENTEVSNFNTNWKNERRIVEIDVLAKNLYCDMCRSWLHLSDIRSERRYGLGSIFEIHCTGCGCLKSVETGKRNEKGAFDVNSKAAIVPAVPASIVEFFPMLHRCKFPEFKSSRGNSRNCMIHAGMGPTHVNNFLTAINLPTLNATTLRKKEQEISKNIQHVAEESCKRAQEEEISKSADKIQASFDAGWQRIGTGWQYNSNTGHGSMIGNETGKVIGFTLRSKVCRICDIHAGKNETVPSHDCTKNWSGSSKAMEPDMANSLCHQLSDLGCCIDVLHADNDSTTTSKLKIDFVNLDKVDDQNHTKKGISNKLYSLSKTHKELRSPDVKSYLVRSIMYAIKENTNSSEKIREALGCIVPHIYGNHESCDNFTWCKFKQNPATFKYKYLPNGKPLVNESLRQDLEDLIKNLQNRSDNLKSMGSTQANESFNNIIASKAPKSRSYGSSVSLMNRLSASVLQKNEGYTWPSKVNEASSLSPGKNTLTLGKRLDHKRELLARNHKTIKFKRRRLFLKKKRKQSELKCTVKEGDTYEQGIESCGEINFDEIPSPFKSLSGNETYIIFDLETTSLSRDSDIIQLSATDGNRNFSKYITPRCDISFEASKVTGLSFSKSTNKMYHQGKTVETTTIQTALLDFIDFLDSVDHPVLVGHNITNFDIIILAKRLKEFNLFNVFSRKVTKFIDTLKIAKRVFDKNTVPNHKQETLVKSVLGLNYEAHNSEEDVSALYQLFEMKLKSECMADDMCHINYHFLKLSFAPLLQSKTISKLASVKLSRNGIGLHHLKLAHMRDSHRGVNIILKDNKVSTKSISSIINYFQEE